MNYDWKQRYLFEVNGRYDGSSKFPEDERFGFFPSVSAGWRISEEPFMTSTRDWLDNLKLRASYGTLGNGNVSPYLYLESMAVGKTSVILNGAYQSYTSLPAVLPDGITWEKATTLNLGLDLTVLRNRLNFTFDWYTRDTDDMYTDGPVLPATFGASVPKGNYADLETKGWELSIGWKDSFVLGGSPFHYNISAGLWDSHSVITRYNNPTKNLASTYYEGAEVGEIWGYVTEGLFQSEDEIAHHALPSSSVIKISSGQKWLPGDLKFADLDGNNVIDDGDNTVDNPGDRRVIGNTSPRYQYSFTLGANWKGFGINAFFQGVGKRDWYFGPDTDLFYGPYGRPYSFQPTKMMADVWSEDNPDAYYPRLRTYISNTERGAMGVPQTRYLQDVSYLRLKSLTLDYTFPKALTQKIGMEQAQIYLTGQNLFTWSGLFKHTDNFDPEVIENSQDDVVNGGGQGMAYPMQKSITLGVNLTF